MYPSYSDIPGVPYPEFPDGSFTEAPDDPSVISMVFSDPFFAAVAVFIAACVVLTVIGIVRNARGDTARHRRLTTWAHSRGLEYTKGDQNLVGRWFGSPFDRGDRKRARNVVRGRMDGSDVIAFDYEFTEGVGDSKNTLELSIAVMKLPARLSRLELTPRSFGYRLAGWGGSQNIEVESEEFNRQWFVKAGERKFAVDVLNPRAQEALLRAGSSRSLSIEGDDLICFSPGALEPTDAEARWRMMSDLIATIPRFVWLDHGHDPERTSR